jgi:RNA polymerase sigma factor (sigma-70 family)
LSAMTATVATGRTSVEEARLARAAAAGDDSAFATLYERYADRAYNLAYRVTSSEHDAADATQEAFLNVMRRLPHLDDCELAFGSYLFTATRNACYDLIEKRRRAQPSDAIPESATPVGASTGGAAPDPGDPEEDPDRKLLLESQQEEIREANARLPERQREALALRELEELSYDEIAAIMEMNRNSVAQLISRARINLRDELRGTALASIAISSPECERALPLIAMRDDGQLDAAGDDAAWLDAHLAGCESCRLGLEAMQEAGASYRAWAPIAVAPWLFEETMAKAAELAGADWSDVAAPDSRRRRRRTAIAATLAVLLLLGGSAALLASGGDSQRVPVQPAAGKGPAGIGASPPPPLRKARKPKAKAPSRKREPQPTQAAAASEPIPATPVTPDPAGEPSSPPRRSEQAGVRPTQATSHPPPEEESEPPQPEPELPPPAEEPPPPPPAEEPPEEPTPPKGPPRSPPTGPGSPIP